MKKIYVIAFHVTDDWTSVEIAFEKKEDAEKWIKKNKSEKDYGDYVIHETRLVGRK